MLKAYASLDPTAQAFAVLVKLWAKGEHLCGPKEGHLSSYALTLLALYFLQVDDSVQMPCLPTEMFDGKTNTPPEHNIRWSCPLPLPVLVCRFFHFYASTFAWGNEVVSVRVGQRMDIGNECFQNLHGRWVSYRLHVEDPFLLHRNLNCVLKEQQENMLYMKICEACSLLQVGGIPPGLSVVQTMYSEPSPLEALHASASTLSSTNGAAGGGNGRISTKPASPKDRITSISSKNATVSGSESTREPTPTQRGPGSLNTRALPMSASPFPEDVPETWLASGSWKTERL